MMIAMWEQRQRPDLKNCGHAKEDVGAAFGSDRGWKGSRVIAVQPHRLPEGGAPLRWLDSATWVSYVAPSTTDRSFCRLSLSLLPSSFNSLRCERERQRVSSTPGC
ncbi:magnesium transporter CorA family protein [Sesbania bispinosa]|nr:magnesium transporter CorA family protein [Sesbania bispinosa]